MSVVIAAIGAGLFLFLGLAHAVFTFQSTPTGGPMMPLDPEVLAAMGKPGGIGMEPKLESTLFKAWIGFNMSHAAGVVIIASIVLYHVLDDFGAALDQPWFLALLIVVPVVYVVLAFQYWFNKPRDAIIFGAVLLWAGALVEVL